MNYYGNGMHCAALFKRAAAANKVHRDGQLRQLKASLHAHTVRGTQPDEALLSAIRRLKHAAQYHHRQRTLFIDDEPIIGGALQSLHRVATDKPERYEMFPEGPRPRRR